MHWWVAQGIDENQNKRFLQMSDFWQPPAPQPQVHTLHRWVAQTGHLWQQLRIQPRHNQALPFYLKICKSTLFIPIWMYGITQQHTFICNELQFDRFFFLVFFSSVFSCAAAADSVDYFLVLIFLCTAWLLLITGGSSNRLCPISNRVCKAVSSIFSDFCFQYFFFPGTFTGG